MRAEAMGVYIAMPYRWGSYADRVVAPELVEIGCAVVSTWHCGHAGQRELEMPMAARAKALRGNLEDLRRADLVLLIEQGEGRESYVEVGRALERGTPVVYVSADPARPFLSVADPLVHFAPIEADALEVIERTVNVWRTPGWGTSADAMRVAVARADVEAKSRHDSDATSDRALLDSATGD